LAEAFPIAQQIYGQLAPSCERLAIAGSIRRGKLDVGDVELVAIPRYIEEPSRLWGDTNRVSVLDRVLGQLEAPPSVFLERILGGDRYMRLRHVRSGLQVDLFITTRDQFGLTLLTRTGPADYSHWLVTEARRRGFHSCGGWLRRGLAPHSETTYRDCGHERIPTPEERDVFAALAMPWIEPTERIVSWEQPRPIFMQGRER
jgi:DNA polymerase/3'-5' exonuclease PolX